MRTSLFCNHFRAMSEYTTCRAGVAYETFKGMAFDLRPCFCKRGEPMRPGCSLAVFPTSEELAARDAADEKRLEDLGKARDAIVASLGGPWKKGAPGRGGEIDCPVCGAATALQFARAGYNGHIHARCKTAKCVAWME